MKFQPKTVEYYDWFEDIQPALCRHLDIDKKYFRDYHEVVHPDYESMKPRPYYDFWHVWLTVYGDNLRNDSYVKVYFGGAEEPSEYLVENITKEYGPWAVKLLDATRALCIEQGWNEEDKAIIVWFSW